MIYSEAGRLLTWPKRSMGTWQSESGGVAAVRKAFVQSPKEPCLPSFSLALYKRGRRDTGKVLPGVWLADPHHGETIASALRVALHGCSQIKQPLQTSSLIKSLAPRPGCSKRGWPCTRPSRAGLLGTSLGPCWYWIRVLLILAGPRSTLGSRSRGANAAQVMHSDSSSRAPCSTDGPRGWCPRGHPTCRERWGLCTGAGAVPVDWEPPRASELDFKFNYLNT